MSHRRSLWYHYDVAAAVVGSDDDEYEEVDDLEEMHIAIVENDYDRVRYNLDIWTTLVFCSKFVLYDFRLRFLVLELDCTFYSCEFVCFC